MRNLYDGHKTSFAFKQSIFFNINSDGHRIFLLRPECNDSLKGLQQRDLNLTDDIM